MRDIKAQPFAWTTREAWEKIETLPFKKQMSCKMVYVALSIISKKQKNTEKIEAYKFMIARYGSMSEKSVQRYLPELENLGIIFIEPQDRESNGKFKKCKIWLRDTVLAAGQLEDSSETDGGQMEDTESDINNKENKPIKTIKDNNLPAEAEQTEPLEEIIRHWNNDFKKKIASKNRTIAIGENIFKQCRGVTTPLIGEYKKLRKKMSDDEIKQAMFNYAVERNSRDSDSSDYATHCFSLFDFIKQSNGAIKFLNQ